MAGSEHNLRSAYELGKCYNLAGNARKAIELLEKTLYHSKHISGVEDPEVSNLKHELAGTYFGIGKVRRASELLQEITYVNEQTQEELQDANLLRTQHALAMCYLHHGLGEAIKAVELLEKVVKVRKITREVDDPARTEPQHALSKAYLQADQFDNHMVIRGDSQNRDYGAARGSSDPGTDIPRRKQHAFEVGKLASRGILHRKRSR
jgi:tetratricopeptide (TPR) repeat protein